MKTRTQTSLSMTKEELLGLIQESRSVSSEFLINTTGAKNEDIVIYAGASSPDVTITVIINQKED